jgi:hypothetical protein
VLGGSSPDYAVVAQKGGDPHLLALFADVFKRDFGLSASTLLRFYDTMHRGDEVQSLQLIQDAARMAELEATVSFLNAENERREAALEGLRTHLQARELAIVALEWEYEQLSESHQLLTQTVEAEREREAAFDHEIIRLRAIISEIYRSSSWRVTKPLRFSSRLARRAHTMFRGAAFLSVRGLARCARPLLVKMSEWPWLREPIVRLMGGNSRLVTRARIFLFGPPPMPIEPVPLDVPMTRQANRVLSVIDRARAGKQPGADTKAPNKG